MLKLEMNGVISESTFSNESLVILSYSKYMDLLASQELSNLAYMKETGTETSTKD